MQSTPTHMRLTLLIFVFALSALSLRTDRAFMMGAPDNDNGKQYLTVANYASETVPGPATGGKVTKTLKMINNSNPCAGPLMGLVNWWTFDETMGTLANDIRAGVNNYGNYGPGSSKPNPTMGMVKYGLCFDGVNDYVEVGLPGDNEINFLGSCSAPGPVDSLTIDMWIKTSVSGGTLVILDKRASVSGKTIGYSLFLFNGRLGIQLNGLNYVAPMTSPNVADNNWHFIAATLARCSQPQGKLYVDSSIVHTFTPAAVSLDNLANSSKLWIGRREPSFPVVGSSFFKGCLDELEFFKRALSAQELNEIYSAASSGKCKAVTCDKPSFSYPKAFTSNSFPLLVAGDDFNNDGNPDLVVGNASGSVAEFKGSGLPLLFPSTGIYQPVSSVFPPRSIATGDFNKDGRRDLAVAPSGNNLVSVFLNNEPSSPFSPRLNFGLGFGALSPSAVAVGDFDKDGYDDLVVANATSNNLSVLFNSKISSVFQSAIIVPLNPGGVTPIYIAAGDLNNDGNLDLAVANNSSGSLSVLLGTGQKSSPFQTPIGFNITSPSFPPTMVVMGDLNGDGQPDLIVSCAQFIMVLLNNGQSSLFPSTGTVVLDLVALLAQPGATTASVAVADFNCDGKLDLVVGNDPTTNNIVVLLGNGDGTFAQETIYSTGGDSHSVAIGDFNNDGKPDIVATNRPSNTVTVMLNECCCGCILPTLEIQPVSQNICPSDTAIFVAAANGDQLMLVQWQISTDGGMTWNSISGATSPVLMVKAKGLYRAVFTNSCGTVTTNAAGLTLSSSLC